MDTDGHGFALKEETGRILNCAFEVLNHLGCGLLEKPYENALVVEFGLQGIPCSQQRRYDVYYKHARVGEFIPDLIAFDAVVVDAKVIDRITDHEIGKMPSYLSITGCRIGLILNFKRARLDWKRVVHPSAARPAPAATSLKLT